MTNNSALILRDEEISKPEQQIPNLSDTSSNENGEEQNYRDFSNIIDQKCNVSVSSNNGGLSPANYSFPMKLHYILGNVENDNLSHIISWQPHGRCFVVHNRVEFVKRILPNWFRQGSFTSFQRQLNLYRFRRVTSGADKGGYYHELFLRGKEFLSHRIKRTTVKGNGPRKPASPGTEPNFYIMPYLPFNKTKTQNTAITNNSAAPAFTMKQLIGTMLSSDNNTLLQKQPNILPQVTQQMSMPNACNSTSAASFPPNVYHQQQQDLYSSAAFLAQQSNLSALLQQQQQSQQFQSLPSMLSTTSHQHQQSLPNILQQGLFSEHQSNTPTAIQNMPARIFPQQDLLANFQKNVLLNGIQ